jgi:hypothetical protein
MGALGDSPVTTAGKLGSAKMQQVVAAIVQVIQAA